MYHIMLKLGNKKSQTSLVERGGPSIEALLPVFVHIVPINEYLLRRLNREAIDNIIKYIISSFVTYFI